MLCAVAIYSKCQELVWEQSIVWIAPPPRAGPLHSLGLVDQEARQDALIAYVEAQLQRDSAAGHAPLKELAAVPRVR